MPKASKERFLRAVDAEIASADGVAGKTYTPGEAPSNWTLEVSGNAFDIHADDRDGTVWINPEGNDVDARRRLHAQVDGLSDIFENQDIHRNFGFGEDVGWRLSWAPGERLEDLSGRLARLIEAITEAAPRFAQAATPRI